VLAYVQRQRIPVGHSWMLACIALAWASRDSSLYPYFLTIAEAYFCFWFAYCLPWYGFSRFGDYSYGVYLWGFPCQQLCVSWLDHPRPSEIILTAFPLALGLAVASWHLVEQPALRLKNFPIYERFRNAIGVSPKLGNAHKH